jgi:hypothetical protein
MEPEGSWNPSQDPTQSQWNLIHILTIDPLRSVYISPFPICLGLPNNLFQCA